MFALLLSACSDRGFSLVRKDPLTSEPDIVISPAEVRFEPVPLGCSQTMTLSVKNEGGGPLDVAGSWLESDDPGIADWEVEQLETTLLAGEETGIEVRYTPTLLGEVTAQVLVESDDPDEPRLTLPANASAFDPQWQLDVYTQDPEPVDVLWVIDNSGSMWQEQDRVRTELDQFFDWFVALDLDYHMGVVATDVVNPTYSGQLVGSPTYVTPDTPNPAATLADAIKVPGPEMGDEAGLLAMQMALTEPLASGANDGFYRPEARLVVVFLTDEDDQSAYTADSYIQFLTGLKADPASIFPAAIVGDRDGGCDGTCGSQASDAKGGDKYLDVVDAYGGFFESICTCDLAPALEEMGFESTRYVRSFALSQALDRPDMLTVWVDGVEATGWTYDEETNSVEFETAPVPGSQVVIRYPVGLVCPE